MKHFIPLILLLYFSIFNISAQSFRWARDIGGIYSNGSIYFVEKTLTIDSSHNSYVTGDYYFSVDFDPGPDTFYLKTSTSFSNAYVSKLDSKGNFVWAKAISGPFMVSGKNIAIDKLGYIYIVGTFKGEVDFDPGLSVFKKKAIGNMALFILKLDSDGNFVSVKVINNFDFIWGTSIAIDKKGNIYLAGTFKGNVDFDPGVNTHYLKSNKNTTTLFHLNIFVMKLDNMGEFKWAGMIGKENDQDPDIESAIRIDNSGNVYITGGFSGTKDFDFDSGIHNLTAGSKMKSFLLKIDPFGKFIWAKRFPDNSWISSISTDNFNNLYISGGFTQTVDFDFGSGIFSLTPKGNQDGYILKLNKNSDFMWAKSYGGNGKDNVSFLTTDYSGNVFCNGYFNDKVDFNPSGDGGKKIAVRNNTLFMMKLDSFSDFSWVISFDDLNYQTIYKFPIVCDYDKSIYLGGTFTGTVDFDPGPNKYNVNSYTNFFESFTLKLSDCSISTSIDTVQTCDSYTWIDGKTYTESTDTAEYILTNAQGCDSIVSLDLTIYKKDSIAMQTSVCNVYIWKDDTLKNTGVYRYDTLNIYGCDSTVTLDLTINKSSDFSFKVTSCDSYIWHDSLYTQSGIYRFDTINSVGCDSIVTLDLILNSSSSTTLDISACESYYWHDSIYTSSGIYRFDTLNTSGCDSTITLNLTIVDKIEKLDTMYICQGDTIEIFDNEIWEKKLVSKTFISQKGCDSIQNIQVVLNPLPEGIITESICEGDSIFVVNNWFSEEGVYTINKENTGECDSLYSVNITIRPLKYSYDTIKICQGDTIEVFGFEISTETDVEQSYVGSNDCDSTVYVHITVLPLSSSQSQITLCPGDSILIAGDWIKISGEYREHLTGINGCDSISNIQISVLQEPDAPSIITDCENARIIAIFDDMASEWNILWSNSDSTKSTFYTAEQQAYAVLTTSSGCELRYDFDIPQMPDLSALPEFRDTTVKTGEKIEVSTALDTTEWQILWLPEDIIDCPSCQSIIISQNQDVQITATFTHTSGCVFTRNFNITIDNTINWDIPNIFIPNGDGINDNWTFTVPKDINIVSCSIFDRWGEKIYYSGNNNQINWDGTFKGNRIMRGVYIYIIEFVDSKGEKKVIAGDVTVVR